MIHRGKVCVASPEVLLQSAILEHKAKSCQRRADEKRKVKALEEDRNTKRIQKGWVRRHGEHDDFGCFLLLLPIFPLIMLFFVPNLCLQFGVLCLLESAASTLEYFGQFSHCINITSGINDGGANIKRIMLLQRSSIFNISSFGTALIRTGQ